MITGELRSRIDQIWDAFWSGGISNPLEVIEQITYLLFIKRLDELHTLQEKKAARLGGPLEKAVFPKGKDDKKRPYEDLRWSRFKHFKAKEMFAVVAEHVFPFIRTLQGDQEDSAQDHAGEEEKYTLVLANPPFAGSLDCENCAKDLQQIVKTRKTELLFLALFLRLLKPGGRAAVIVPDGVLFGSSNAHQTLRQLLVEERSSTPSSPCPAACSGPTRGSPPPSCSSPRPTPAAPTTSGSTTWTPTASRSTTSATHCCRTTNWDRPPRSPPRNT
jgi:type I restriction-modification system DNA methylase subunit